jgi:hypothetical protein
MRLIPFLLVAGLLAAQVPPREQPGYDSIQAARLKADLMFLASDALQGRRSLQPGSEVAIQWIASEFAKAGLTPLVGDSYLQPVPMIEYMADRNASTLTFRHGGASRTYGPPEATGGFQNEVAVSGPLVFVGYGITAPDLNYDDYAGIDAKGKVALMFSHEPQENDSHSIFNGKGNTRYANSYAKILNAERHGAVAVLNMADPNHPAAPQLTAEQQQARERHWANGPQIPPEALADGGTDIPVFNISPKLAAELFESAGKKPAEVQTAIDSKCAPASFAIPDTTIDLRTVVAERKRGVTYNVAGLLEGSDSALKAETIVFSGHYDHLGTGPAGVYHGADDNGSGTVAVVEMARAFAANPVKPRRSLLFIVFAAEERGLLGSHYYVARPLRPLGTTRAVINFDMIGRNEAPVIPSIPEPGLPADATNELGLIGTDYSPDYRAAMEAANHAVGLELNYRWDQDSEQNVLFRSDQYPFLLHGIPAVWWFTGFHPDYHQVTDTVDKINFEKMTKIVRLAYLTGFDFGVAARGPRLAVPRGQ